MHDLLQTVGAVKDGVGLDWHCLFYLILNIAPVPWGTEITDTVHATR